MVIIDNAKLIMEFRMLLNNVYVQILLWLVLADIASGIAKGFKIKEAVSNKGLLGIVKHMLVVCLVVVAYPYLKILGMETVATWFVFFYIAVYGISITENLGQLGVPIPKWIKKRLEKLKDSADDNNGKEGEE
ncbi:phage holin family protein [Enterococcus sp. LJL120]